MQDTNKMKMMKLKPKICKSKGCNVEPMQNCNYCERHWFPANTPEEQLVMPDLVEAQFDYYEEKDEERRKDGKIHISSLNLCIREKVFQHLRPEPLTPIKVKWFSTGNAVHHKLQVLAARKPQYQIEKPVIRGNIIAHIDIYDNKRKFPIEAKSLVQAEQEVPRNFHVDQLKMYMAMTDDDIGVLFYDPLLAYDIPFAEWTIRMTKEERNKKLEEIETKAAIYSLAMARKDPSLAPYIFGDREYDWHCDRCTYYKECEQMRIKERANNWNKK
jgi:hypothetical protein